MQDDPATTENKDDFFFIVGSGRSGTTLLQTLLSAHPDLTVPPETHFMKRAMTWGAGRRAEPENFETFWAELVAWSRFRDLGIDADRVRARIERGGGRQFQDVFAAKLRTVAEEQGARRVGEKTPGHYQHVGRLLTWYPEARVLFVRRDPRAVVASQLSTPWVTGELRPASLLSSFTRRLRLMHVAERAALWRLANEHFLQSCAHDPRVHLVAYEALVASPEDCLRRICDFLGEDFAPGMLAGRDGPAREAETTDAQDFETWRHAHRAAARAAVKRSGLTKWRKILSPHEIAMIEGLCGQAMTSAGYEVESRGYRARMGRWVAMTCLALLRSEDRVRGIGERS